MKDRLHTQRERDALPLPLPLSTHARLYTPKSPEPLSLFLPSSLIPSLLTRIEEPSLIDSREISAARRAVVNSPELFERLNY